MKFREKYQSINRTLRNRLRNNQKANVKLKVIKTFKKLRAAKLFSCLNCDLNFKHESSLVRHNKIKHPQHPTNENKENIIHFRHNSSRDNSYKGPLSHKPNCSPASPSDKNFNSTISENNKSASASLSNVCNSKMIENSTNTTNENCKLSNNHSVPSLNRLIENISSNPDDYIKKEINCLEFTSNVLGKYRPTERLFVCSKCEVEVSGEYNFEKHFEMHHCLYNNNTCKCSECPKVFQNKQDLFWHTQNAHFQLTTHECPECDAIFVERMSLKCHINDVHKGDVVDLCQLKCWVCKMSFNEEENFIQHFDDKHF